jgi:hypothetical protein
MESIVLSPLVIGNPATLDDPNHHPHQPLEEISRLREASAAGELVTVKTLFGPWLAQPPALRIQIDRFMGSLLAALENVHLQVASYPLSQGLPMNIH